LCSIGMAGVIAAIIFFGPSGNPELSKKLRLACGYGLLLLVAGWALSPLGISKIRDTPAWCMLCAGSSTLIFLVLYWVADVRHWTRWAAFVKPAGSNTLLTYLLPYIWQVIPGLAPIFGRWRVGIPGVMKAFAFTALMLVLSAALTRIRVRLQL